MADFTTAELLRIPSGARLGDSADQAGVRGWRDHTIMATKASAQVHSGTAQHQGKDPVRSTAAPNSGGVTPRAPKKPTITRPEERPAWASGTHAIAPSMATLFHDPTVTATPTVATHNAHTPSAEEAAGAPPTVWPPTPATPAAVRNG